MRKQRKRLSLNTETVRVLADGNLYAFRGGLIASMPQTECCTQSVITSHYELCCYPTNTSNEFTDCC